MARGYPILIMGMFGFLMPRMVSGHTPPADTGYKQIMVIPGFQIIHGVGRLSTMAAGAMMITMAGNGSRATNGRLPGLAGAMGDVIARAILAGRL